MFRISSIKTPQEFYFDLLARIKTARHRIWAQAMLLETGYPPRDIDPYEVLVDELIAAKRRGVQDVKMCIDDLTFVSTYTEPNWWPSLSSTRRHAKKYLYQKKLDMLKTLEDAGVEVTICNPHNMLTSIIPEIGRNHIKNYGVDDVAWMGGGNMQTDWLECQDLMIRYQQPLFVDTLRELFLKDFHAQRAHADSQIQIDETHTLFVDAGIRGSSIIYDHALRMIRAAQPGDIIRLASQYPSTGKILESLITKAKQGVHIQIIITEKEDHFVTGKIPCLLAYQLFISRIRDIPNIDFRHFPGKIHAKLLIIDHARTQEVLHGSHNLERAGVWLGTQELAMHTTDPYEAENYISFYVSLLRQSPLYNLTDTKKFHPYIAPAYSNELS